MADSHFTENNTITSKGIHNSRLEDNKKLFTCCRELGHATMYPNQLVSSLGMNCNRMKIESEMNKFTTKLLLYNKDNYLYDSID